MDAKHRTVVPVLLLSLLLGHEALAFYNPQTGRWLNRDPINEIGSKILIRKKKLFGRVEEVNLHAFAVNNALGFCDPLGRDVQGTVMHILFPESWGISGSGAGAAGGWYATHCAAHCWGHSLNRLMNCPLGKGAALEAAWTLGWELIEWASTLENGKDGWGYEPLYDRLTDVFANGVGAGLSEKCAGKCQECESAEQLVKKAYKAARCCDHACAQLQSTFLAYAHAMQILTGEEWEE